MVSIEPVLFLLLFGLTTVAGVLLIRLWDISEEITELKEELRKLKGDQPEFQPEWF